MSYIILKHPIHTAISNDECFGAIPENLKEGSPVFIEIKPVEIPFGGTIDDWEQVALDQKKYFIEIVKPVLEQHPDSQIFYFGFAPIPLIIHLGTMFGSWRKVTPMFRHHTEGKWYYEFNTDKQAVFSINGLPEDENLSNKDVNLNISISGLINGDITKTIVGDSLMKIVSLQVETPTYDILSKQSDILLFSDNIDKIFRRILEKYPRHQTVHIFGSLTIETAFALGTKIQPNIYPKVQTYQFKSTSSEPYQPAILINQPEEVKVNFTEDEEKLAATCRKEWNYILKTTFPKFIENLREKKGNNWYGFLDAKEIWQPFNVPYWNHLESLIVNQLIVKDSINLENTTVADGFDYDQTRYEWSLDTGFFIAVQSRLNESEKIIRAGRLFLLHESLHYSFNGINKQVASDIGSFPKVVEDADYQADVYALLHEYALSKLPSGDYTDDKSAKEWFINAIDIMTETMWSFDDRGSTIKEMQVRRMNRYLIWYWQSIRIKYANELAEIIDILSEKPVIEFSGLRIRANSQRVFYNLEAMAKDVCELGIYARGKVTRATPANYKELIEGFRERNGEKIKETLEMFYKLVY